MCSSVLELMFVVLVVYRILLEHVWSIYQSVPTQNTKCKILNTNAIVFSYFVLGLKIVYIYCFIPILLYFPRAPSWVWPLGFPPSDFPHMLRVQKLCKWGRSRSTIDYSYFKNQAIFWSLRSLDLFVVNNLLYLTIIFDIKFIIFCIVNNSFCLIGACILAQLNSS